MNVFLLLLKWLLTARKAVIALQQHASKALTFKVLNHDPDSLMPVGEGRLKKANYLLIHLNI